MKEDQAGHQEWALPPSRHRPAVRVECSYSVVANIVQWSAIAWADGREPHTMSGAIPLVERAVKAPVATRLRGIVRHQVGLWIGRS